MFKVCVRVCVLERTAPCAWICDETGWTCAATHGIANDELGCSFDLRAILCDVFLLVSVYSAYVFDER